MNSRLIESDIARAADEAQLRIDAELAIVGGQPDPGSPLDQAGLRNGKDIVAEYLAAGEVGPAMEHLAYMIRETGIAVSEETLGRIRAAAAAMNIRLSI